MSGAARLAAFAAVLALVFAGAAAAGGAIDPDRDATPAPPHEPGQDEARGAHGGEDEAHPVRGLATAAGGLRIVVDDPDVERGRAERVAFRIVGHDGETVRDFDVAHEKRMHVIIVRRDLTGFQHLHPEQAPDGTWNAPVRLDAAGSYRLFADFTRGGEPQTLATDLRVDGRADLRALPSPTSLSSTDSGYEVRLDQHGDELRFAITRDGEAVRTQPYLGAGGHLVALREGDLAFLHVHPTADDAAAFDATFPTPGRYRLFLQFKHDDRVHTVAFTHEVRA